ncbi:MAG: amino acid adenylation domain-containing protein, partial [Pseudomonadota bacterium]|nr:amino acid adenylation domain-containing protein [Pseudomonadota bacterium]
MTVAELITKLRQQGIKIRSNGEELEIDAPHGALSSELLDELTNRKVELLRLLSWSRRSEVSADTPLEPVDRNVKLPLSWAQQRLWFLDQLEPGSPAYNISWTVRLRGVLNITAMQRALDKLIKRHESLRTVFPSLDGDPEQRILAKQKINIVEENLIGIPDEQFRSHLNKLASRKFDLSVGPLLRLTIIKLSDEEHVLLVLIHHIVADGASMRILFRELAAFYEAELNDSAADLDKLSIQYADYSSWQRKWLDGAEQSRQAEYWLNQLKGLPPLLELPTDRPRSAAMRYRGASVLKVIPSGVADALRKLGREEGCTLFMVMLSVFYVLLMRYTDRTDLVVGSPLGGRPRKELESLIGFFINTVVLRANLGGNPSFKELLANVRSIALDAHANQELPFEKLVEILKPQRELSYSPIFQVMFDLQEEPRWRLPVRDLEVIPEVVFSSRTSTFDLTLSIRQSENGLDAMFEYDTDLFNETTIERMAGHYQNLLESIIVDISTPIADLPLMAKKERSKLLESWNGLSTAFPAANALPDLISEQAISQPNAIAIECQQKLLTYVQLEKRANQFAQLLINKGLKRNETVAICSNRCLNYFVAQLAILKTGAAVLPIDPSYPINRLNFMLNDSDARYVIFGDGLNKKIINSMKENVNILYLSESINSSSRLEKFSNLSQSKPNDVAYILYTSGSTGQPKGVELEHRGLVNYIHQLGIKTSLLPGDRVLQFANLSFDIALEECFGALVHGATLVLRNDEMTSSVQAFLSYCNQKKISWLSLPTAWWHELCNELNKLYFELPKELRLILIGGEKVNQKSFRQWHEKVGTSLRLINTYGPTEASIVASWIELTYLDPDHHGEIPIGQPIPNSRIWVVDERCQPLPVGVPGEVCIAGVGVARGYRNRPELSAEKFIPDPFSSDSTDQLYFTGDLARYSDDGSLLFLGRKDHQIKLRGHRIEPGEIESALLLIDGIEMAAVVMNDQIRGDQQLVAYVVGDQDINKLKNDLSKILPSYMLPTAIFAVDQIPMTPNGKIDRVHLASKELVYDTSGHYTAPENSSQKIIAEIWADVLHREKIGIKDNFFDLGGHSLLATRVVSRVRDALGIDLPLRELFNHPTIVEISARLDSLKESDQLRPVDRYQSSEGLPPLSWPQERLWLLDQLEPNNPAYTLPWVARCKGHLDINALQATVNTLVERHSVLRTHFAEQHGKPVQIVAPRFDLKIQLEKIHQNNDESIDEKTRLRLIELSETPFDLSLGPLFRVHLLQINSQDHILMFLMHHIVADGWSMGLLCNELSKVYNGILLGESVALNNLTYQYVDYSVWQRNWLSGDKLRNQEKFWVKQLKNAPALIDLPKDFPRPPVQSFRGEWVSVNLDEKLLNRLRSLATQNESSLYMLLLACFKVLLFRHSGITDILVGTSVAGRVRTELEPMIGCFLNTLILRTQINQDDDFLTLLKDVRGTALNAFDNQNIPFERLLDLLKPERSVAHPPLVQIMFTLQNNKNEKVKLKGLNIETFNVDRHSSKFDLSVALAEGNSNLQIGFEYNSDLFKRSTIARMLEHFEKILRAITDQPDISIANISLEANYSQPQFKNNFEPIPENSIDASLPERFAWIVKKHGEKIAVQTD